MKAKKKTPKRKTKAKAGKKEFMSKLSYGWRNPLNAIIGFSELMSSKQAGKVNHKQKEYLDDIVNSAKELLNFLTGVSAPPKKKKTAKPKKVKAKKRR